MRDFDWGAAICCTLVFTCVVLLVISLFLRSEAVLTWALGVFAVSLPLLTAQVYR